MLIWERFKNACVSAGYARAASQLATQGHYEEAKHLMLNGVKETVERKKAIRRLERVKKAKASYEPGNYYMKGKKVAFWKGKAHA
jgi:hypothetical protein|tara:strand:- start:1892 stop:2146 length:255 start_codon:yes stop_codon:yes gene_type:complete